MEFKEYEEKARKTAVYPDRGNNLIYPVLGLAGEAGEVVEKVKKLIRDKNREIDAAFLEAIKKELGDVLWYIAAICAELGISMDEVARLNIEKLYSRMERNKLHGEGDDR
ncbi:nucleoside triphosphate pyrophosphohydrolase family protein [Candidatus Woesearchaeota archaeon]|nr:nucleoside triphosphate pyrophosphohydrolase family protein [Candidatus Woesearchaeota archaeon]